MVRLARPKGWRYEGMFLFLALLLSPTSSQWLSFRNPKSDLWFPNMPASPRALQQRSSVGTSLRGLSPTSTSATHSQVKSHQGRQRPRSAPASYHTLHGGPVHGGIISRQENSHAYARNPYQSSSRLSSSSKQDRQPHSHSPDPPKEKSYSSSARLAALPPQGQHKVSDREGTPFAQRAGSWWSGQAKTAPTVVSSKHLSINLNGRNGARPEPTTSYASSRRLLEVGRGVEATPTRRPITQTAGALQDSWPNSNAHHHMSPMLKNQKEGGSGGSGYYQVSHGSGSPWGSTVRVSDTPIQMSSMGSKWEGERSYVPDGPVDRHLSVGTSREKMVSNTLNTLAKLSPKKPIYVFMRAEGIAAIEGGADAGEVIKKLAGSSKLPFYNGTRSLPRDNKPTVFLAPEDMVPPGGYGKIPIPNLKAKEGKPTYTKILLPGGTKMNSHLSHFSTTTSTTVRPYVPSVLTPQVPYGGNGSLFSTDGLSIEQKLRILQMLKGQAEIALGQGASSQFQFGPAGAGQNSMFSGSGVSSGGPTFQGSVAETDIQKLIGSIVETAVSQTVGQMMPGPTQPPPFVNRPYPSPFPNAQPKVGGGGNLFGNQGPQGPSIPPYNQGPTQRPRPQGPKRLNPIKNALSLLGIQSTPSPNNRTPGPTSPRPPPMFLNQAKQRQNGPFNGQQGPTNEPFNGQQGPTNGPFNGQQGPTNGPFNGQQGPTNGPFNGQQGLTNGPFNVQQGPTNGLFNAQQGPTNGPFNAQQGPTNGPFNVQQGPSNGPFNAKQGPTNGPFNGQQGPTNGPFNGQQGPVNVPFNGQKNPTNAPFSSQQNPTNGPFNNQRQPTPGPFNTPQGPGNGPFSNQNGGPPRNNFNGPPPGFNNGPPPNYNNNGPLPNYNNNGPPPNVGSGPGQNGSPPQRQPSAPMDANNVHGKGSTIIVQTPDKSQGQRNTFVISNGGSDLPELRKIMKVINDLNGAEGQQGSASMASPSFPSPPSRPSQQQQPQVMIRHPAGSPTPGPHIVMSSTGPLNQFHLASPSPTPLFLSSPQPQPTLRPQQIFLSSPRHPVSPSSRPIYVSSTPSIDRPMFVSSTSSPVISLDGPSNRPFFVSSSSRPNIVSNNISPSNRPILMSSTGSPFFASSGPTVRPFVSSTPTLLQSPQLPVIKVPVQKPHPPAQMVFSKSPPQRVVSSQTAEELMAAADGKHRIIEIDPSATPQQIQNAIMESILKQNGGVAPTGPIVISNLPSGMSANGLQINQQHSNHSDQGSFKIQSAIEVVPTFEPVTPPGSREQGSSMSGEWRNRLQVGQKAHHHSKELIEDKPGKKKGGQDVMSRREDSSEVIEKVITEEKIVWNPGPAEGEMIPSRIKTEERIILRPHRPTPPANSIETTTSPSKEKSSEESGPEGGSILQNLFRTSLLNKGKLKKSEEGANPKFSLNSAAHNFAHLLRSKLKFEKMKQKLYPSSQPLNSEVEGFNPFLRYLSPSPLPPPLSPNTTNQQGRFKIRPADLSIPSPSSFPTTKTTAGSTAASIPSSPASTGSSAPTTIGSDPTPPTEVFTIPPGTQDERLLFIPAADASRTRDPKPISTVSPSGTIATRNEQNQTVLFTTMNNLPDLMATLSGTKTEVRMINDMNTWQATLDKVKADKEAAPTAPSLTPVTTETLQRRMDQIVDQPMTWRPNGTLPTPTLESFRKGFPSGLGANVLHALSAGFASNGPSAKGQWESPDRNNFVTQEGGAQILYRMSNGVPVPLNPSLGSYQPILLQGTKTPVLAYYGYNWNGGPQLSSTPVIPIDLVRPSDVDNMSLKYHSRFKGDPETNSLKSSSPVYKTKKGKVRVKTTTLDPLDPLSEEYEASSAEDEDEVKQRRKGQTKPRRRRPLQEEDDSGSSSEELPPKVSPKKVALKKADVSVAPKVKVQKEMFVVSGEERKENPPSKLVSEEDKPTSKLPILLAPSIISNKSVVKKTGFSKEKGTAAPFTVSTTGPTTPVPKTTTQLLTTLLTQMTTTALVPPTVPTGGNSPTEDEEFRETQAELKNLLKKIQEKLGGKGDVYELGEEYDYFEELPSTKATTTTKGTKRPKNTKKPKGINKPKKGSKKGTKGKVKGTKGKKTTKKPKIAKSQTVLPSKPTPTTTPTPTTYSTTATPTTTPTPTTAQSQVQHNHNRHPVSSLEALSTASSPPPAARVDGSETPFRNTIRTWLGLGDKADPSTTEVTPTSEDPMTFVYPQSVVTKEEGKVPFRRRPLWVRRKTFGSGESLESVGRPSGGSSGKVIRLVRRKKPGTRRRPVFVPQSLEEDTTPSAPITAVHYPPTAAPVDPTPVLPVETLFQTSNDLSRRVGFSDSNERKGSRSGGKRKLKLVRLKGQRAQWKLRLNNEEEGGPQAERLVAPTAPSPTQEGGVTYQVSGPSSTSVESKVCVHGKCELISKQ